MKRLLYLTICALLAVGLSSCSKDNPKNYPKLIVGTWELESIIYYMDDEVVQTNSNNEFQSTIGATFTFRNDGTVKYDLLVSVGNSMSLVYEYSVKGDYLFMQGVGYQISFEGNRMYLALELSITSGDVKYNKVVEVFKKVK